MPLFTLREWLEFARKGNLAPAFFCLAALVANHSIFRLGAMPLIWPVLIVLALGAIILLAPNIDLRVRLDRFRVGHALVGGLILLPVIASLVLGWQREFPFSGDQSFHLKQA